MRVTSGSLVFGQSSGVSPVVSWGWDFFEMCERPERGEPGYLSHAEAEATPRDAADGRHRSRQVLIQILPFSLEFLGSRWEISWVRVETFSFSIQANAQVCFQKLTF